MKPIPIPGNPQDGTRNPARGGQRAPSDRGYRPSPGDEEDPAGDRPRRPEYRQPEYERPRPYGPRGEGEYGETPQKPKGPGGGGGYERPSRPDPYGHEHPLPEEPGRYESRPKPRP